VLRLHVQSFESGLFYDFPVEHTKILLVAGNFTPYQALDAKLDAKMPAALRFIPPMGMPRSATRTRTGTAVR
jgi:hypothetical protein